MAECPLFDFWETVSLVFISLKTVPSQSPVMMRFNGLQALLRVYCPKTTSLKQSLSRKGVSKLWLQGNGPWAKNVFYILREKSRRGSREEQGWRKKEEKGE